MKKPSSSSVLLRKAYEEGFSYLSDAKKASSESQLEKASILYVEAAYCFFLACINEQKTKNIELVAENVGMFMVNIAQVRSMSGGFQKTPRFHLRSENAYEDCLSSASFYFGLGVGCEEFTSINPRQGKKLRFIASRFYKVAVELYIKAAKNYQSIRDKTIKKKFAPNVNKLKQRVSSILDRIVVIKQLTADISVPHSWTDLVMQTEESEPVLVSKTITVRRQRIIQELIQTEVSYVSQLQAIVNIYLTPLESKEYEHILDYDEIETLFSNITVILSLNETFLSDIQASSSSSSSNDNILNDSKIGDVFFNFSPYFKLYAQYAGNIDKAQRLLSDLQHQSNFNEFCEKASLDARCKGLNLQSLLITPIQRIPRYKLLLQELRKCTPPQHKEYVSLTKALGSISSVASFINESIRAQQNRNNITEIESRFLTNPNFACNGRILLKTGSLLKRSNTQPTENVYEFFLFNNLIAYGRPMAGAIENITGVKYILQRRMLIENTLSIEVVSDSNNNSYNNSDNRWWFKVHLPIKSFMLSADTEEEGREWYDCFQTCIDDLRLRRLTEVFDVVGRNNTTNDNEYERLFDDDDDDNDGNNNNSCCFPCC